MVARRSRRGMQNRCFEAENRAKTDLFAAICDHARPERPQNHAKNPSSARVSTLFLKVFTTHPRFPCEVSVRRR